jgi:hypothetical protein
MPYFGNQGIRVARISPAGELLGVDTLLEGTPIVGPSFTLLTISSSRSALASSLALN